MDLSFPPPRASVEDVTTYLRVDAEPLGILEAINAVPGTSWQYDIRFSEKQQLDIEITAPLQVDPFHLLDGTYPELLWCDSLVVCRNGQLYRIAHPISQATPVEVDHFDDFPVNGLRILNFQRSGKLATDFLDQDKMRALLRSSTWLGSQKYAKSKARLNINILATRLSFSPASITRQELGHDSFRRTIVIDQRSVLISYPGSDKRIVCRMDALGVLHDTESLLPIMNAVRTSELNSFELELQGAWPFEAGPLRGRVQTERLESVVDVFAEKIRHDQEIRAEAKKLRQAELARQADLLNTRVAYAKASELVYWNDHVVGCVPRSELATVALISKLEGMDALPFARYDSLAWAGHEGIDAIVDLQFKPDDALVSYAPVEYEFLFENFILHGHPVQHVALIICWDDQNDPRLVSGPDSWLKSYTDSDKTIPVLILKNIPNVTVRKPNYGVKNG